MSYQRDILIALNRTGKHIYGGTVSDVEIAKRRKAGRAAKQARKANR